MVSDEGVDCGLWIVLWIEDEEEEEMNRTSSGQHAVRIVDSKDFSLRPPPLTTPAKFQLTKRW